MNPLPTPYDILPIPYFPFVPGPVAWLAVILVFAVLMGFAFIPKRSGRPVQRDLPFPFHEAETAIKKLVEAKTIRKEEIFDLSRKLKHVVHAYEDTDLSSLGPDEFEQAIRGSGVPPALANFIRHIASLERMKYDTSAQEAQLRWAVSSLLAALYEYKKSVRAALEGKNAASR